MDEIKSLITIIERLLAPDGCPWDREQTLESMRSSLVEETYEVIEAIDLKDNRHMEEELGDLLFNVVFLCKLAEREHRFTLEDATRHIVAKLIRRHPHVFGEASVKTSEEVLQQWENIKQAEKKDQPRRSILDHLPKDLPSLARAQKMVKKFADRQFVGESLPAGSSPEDQAGETLWLLVQQMAQQGIKADQALRKRLAQLEAEFRNHER